MGRLPIGPGRIASAASILLAGALWAAAGWLPWASQSWANTAFNETADPVMLRRFAWMDAPARVRAQRNLALGRLARRAETESLLLHSARARPLHAPTWLARAELAHQRGQHGRADTFSRLALALWPNRERLLWRSAVLRAEMGEPAASLGLLRSVLRANGERSEAVLAFAERLERDPEQMLAALVPPSDRRTRLADERLTRLLWTAAQRGDARLARALWQALSPGARAERDAVSRYVEALLAERSIAEALEVWRDGAAPRLAERGLSNAGFEELLAQGGLGWRILDAPGTRWKRDVEVRRTGRYSLAISLDGREDTAQLHLAQTVVVEPSARYRLSGQWRGEGITSGSGPFLEVTPRGGRTWFRESTGPRFGSWDWERFELVFRVPEDARLVEIRLRREPGKDLQRRIRGRVWLDDLALVRLLGGKSRG